MAIVRAQALTKTTIVRLVLVEPREARAAPRAVLLAKREVWAGPQAVQRELQAVLLAKQQVRAGPQEVRGEAAAKPNSSSVSMESRHLTPCPPLTRTR